MGKATKKSNKAPKDPELLNFQTYCNGIISKIIKTDNSKVNELDSISDDERLKLLYGVAVKSPILILPNGKSFEKAQEAKILGNKFFADKKYEQALKAYNYGILACPQGAPDHRELLAILISNRSATFFEEKNYENVLADIDYAVSLGAYPTKLHHKLWLRKAKCYHALNNTEQTRIACDSTLTSLKISELSEKDLETKRKEIKTLLESFNKSENEKVEDSVSALNEFEGGNCDFIAAHKKISFDYSPVLGRFARANTNIATGVIIAKEKPHCAVLSHENYLTNCQFCCLSTKNPIACPSCAHVAFCTLSCQQNATFHKIECKILPTLKKFDISVNCAMALRMITQKPYDYFESNKAFLEGCLNNCESIINENGIYESQDYFTAFFLCRNENSVKTEVLHYSVMTTYLLRLLKAHAYFPREVKDEILSSEELFIAKLILRHLLILQFNSHEISELRNITIGPGQFSYHNQNIGAGLYPTLALFNHSCDPSLVRYSIGNQLVYRTIKPIKAGDIIYENYGTLWTETPLVERQNYLEKRYCFHCGCPPCEDKWPLLEEIDSSQMKIGCQTRNCRFEYTLCESDDDISKRCPVCRKETNILPFLGKLSKLLPLTTNAELFYNSGDIKEAVMNYTESLDILYECLRPPHPDMVNAQQRLKTLYLHLGNKQEGFIQKF